MGNGESYGWKCGDRTMLIWRFRAMWLLTRKETGNFTLALYMDIFVPNREKHIFPVNGRGMLKWMKRKEKSLRAWRRESYAASLSSPMETSLNSVLSRKQ